MKTRRLIALAMILLEAAVAGVFFGQWFFPGFVAIAAVTGFTGRWQLAASRERDLRLLLALFVLVLVIWATVGRTNSVSSAALQGGLGYALVQFYLVAQVYELFVRRKRGISSLFVLFGAIVMTASGDVLYTGLRQSTLSTIYLSAAIGFVVLASAFWLTGRNVRPATKTTRVPIVLSAATLLFALLFGSAVSFTLKLNQEELDTWFANLVSPGVDARSLGFPDKAFLHSVGQIKQRDSANVALRVVSAQTPGYMKALTYDVYSDAQWIISVAAEPIDSTPGDANALIPGMNTFELTSTAQPDGDTLHVWPEVDTTGAFFTTLDTVRLRAPYPSLVMDAVGNVANPDKAVRSSYFLEESPSRRLALPLTESERERYMFLPDNLDPGVANLAGALFADAVSTDEKIASVLGYFHENFQYELGITVPDDADPLAYFLLEQPPAHCEYFATGAAVLLRLGGVPCRYVTGFVAVEHNSLGGYWVARNRDAHAWVEAYDDEQGWFIVEATVAEGVPSEDDSVQPGYIGQSWDYLKFLVREVVAVYIAGGIRGLIRWLGDALLHLGGQLLSPVPLALLVMVALGIAFRNFRRKRSRDIQDSEPEYRVKLRIMLNAMDQQLHRHGIDRAPSETLLRFASRLPKEMNDAGRAEQVSRWYRDYTGLRFGPPPSDAQLEELDATLPKLSPVKRERD